MTRVAQYFVPYWPPVSKGDLDECEGISSLCGGLDRNTYASQSVGSLHRKKIPPPQVPKRTCSMQQRLGSSGGLAPLGMSRSSHCESTGSETSLVLETSVSSHGSSSDLHETHSPLWGAPGIDHDEGDKRLSNISEDCMDTPGYSSVTPNGSSTADALLLYPSQSGMCSPQEVASIPQQAFKVSEIERKRQYRVGLNLFNKKPERGIRYLIERNFLEGSAAAVARFLITRKGISKQKIGEYLGDLQNDFNINVLEYFVREMDLSGMQVDVALRKFQSYFIMPGEAQKIEHLMEVFSMHFVHCNPELVGHLFHNRDTVMVLAFSVILLNTDLHTPCLAENKRMKLEDYIKNLRGINNQQDIDRNTLAGIYERIKREAFKPGSDHVTQVLKVQETLVGQKKPNLALPHRRLVCYCRLYEVYDLNKKERQGVHQREVFLFNDMLLITKICSKKKAAVTYSFRQSIALVGLNVTLFETPNYPHGISLSQRVDGKVMMTLNARNEHDRSKFVDDLKESILEMDEMEALRIETELEKQSSSWSNTAENRDSGVATDDGDMVVVIGGAVGGQEKALKPKVAALSNSLLDLNEPQLPKPIRRGSAGSLDSGMSVSFQSSAASTVSRDSSPQTVPANSSNQPSCSVPSTSTIHEEPKGFLSGIFKANSKPVLRREPDPAPTTDV